jgi:hypothetical protein
LYCPPCYEVIIKECSNTIKVKGGLTANTSYYWLIIKPSGKLVQRQVDTDNDGILSIDTTLLGSGLTNAYSGFFTLEIRKGDDYLQKVPLTLGGNNYNCVQIKFATIDAVPDQPFNVIQ